MGERNLVVLPFSNPTGQAGEVLATGLTEALSNALVRAPGIDVVARGAAFSSKGQDLSAQEVGKMLGAAYVLQGTVRLRADEVHVTAELVDARSGVTRWSDNYDRSASEILIVQREIVQQLALNLGTAPADVNHSITSQTQNAAAFESYSRGRFFWNQRTPEGLQQARTYFEEAVSLDPEYALAWSGLADFFVTMYDYGEMTLAESSEQAKKAIDHALHIDPLLAAAHTSRAHLAMHQWQWTEAQSEFERAIELDPGYAPAYHWYALCLTAIGRLDLAVAAMKQARRWTLSSRINADLNGALCGSCYDGLIVQERRTLGNQSRFGRRVLGDRNGKRSTRGL
jgi:TolB-like protein